MAVVATQRWSDKASDTRTDTSSGSLSWDVIGTSNEEAAKAANGIPQINKKHPRNPALVANAISARANGLNAWIVTVSFVPDTGIGTIQQPSQSPITYPASWRFTLATTSEPIDRDVDGNPIVT